MKRILVILFFLIILISCDKDMRTESQRKNAENCMKEAMVEADNWLKTLNEIGYQVLANQKYPVPFDKILKEESEQKEIKKKISHFEKEFGVVKERKFFGVHVLLEGKILTYVPERMKTFKRISPRRLGVKRIEDYYKENIEGIYTLLMYNSQPSKKDYAEELLIMWRDKNDKWWFVDYFIADNI